MRKLKDLFAENKISHAYSHTTKDPFKRKTSYSNGLNNKINVHWVDQIKNLTLIWFVDLL